MGNTPSAPGASTQAESLISQALRTHKVVIFSKRTCGYCDAAKRTLSQEAARLSEEGCQTPMPCVIELDDGSMTPEVAREVQRVLREMTGEATVPRVFVGGDLVGGAVETVRYARSGGLRLALMKAGECQVK